MRGFTALALAALALLAAAKPATFQASVMNLNGEDTSASVPFPDDSSVDMSPVPETELPVPGLNWTRADYEAGKSKAQDPGHHSFLPWPFGGSKEDDSPLFKDSTGNKYPIVLVHGFLGFGNPIFAGILDYFGGFTGSIKKDLESRGHTVFLVDMGPISSNWERAAELYAQIKGGTVDFGLDHSQKYGHERYGRTYKGLYPDWSPSKPVHIIAHSQGGPTARALVDLLARGSQAEIAAEKAAAAAKALDENLAVGNMSYLYAPKTATWARMVHGVVTISSPHKGSTITNVVEDYERILLVLLEALYGFTGALGGDFGGYDFRLDHWGLVRAARESLGDFVRRLSSTKYLKQMCNGFYDNSVEGTRENDKIFKTDRETYWFSISNAATLSVPLSDVEIPAPSMLVILNLFSIPMGVINNRALFGKDSGKWHENDGVVPLYSMTAPENDPVNELPMDLLSHKMDKKKTTPPRGVWQHLGKLAFWDHADAIGLLRSVKKEDVYTLYRNAARVLHSLPERAEENFVSGYQQPQEEEQGWFRKAWKRIFG